MTSRNRRQPYSTYNNPPENLSALHPAIWPPCVQPKGNLRGAIARLQHDELELKTKLAIEEHLSRGVSKGRCPTCTQLTPRPLRVSRLKALSQTIRAFRAELTKVGRALQKLEMQFSDSDFDQSYEDVADLREAKATYEAARKQLTKDEDRLKKLRLQAKTFGKKPQQVDRTKAEITFLDHLAVTGRA